MRHHATSLLVGLALPASFMAQNRPNIIIL